jgi:hypothetical protein
MDAIDYTIRDEISKLVLVSHETIMKLVSDKETPEEYVKNYNECIKKTSLKYFVGANGDLLVMEKFVFVASPGLYYEDWKIAKDAWLDKQFDFGIPPFSASMKLKRLQGNYEEFMDKYKDVRICTK